MAGAVNIRFGAIISGFTQSLSQMGASVQQFTQNLNTNLAAGYAAAAREQRVFDRGLGTLAGNLQSFGRSASIFSAGLGLLAVTSFKSYAEINALQLGLQNITGSVDGATKRFAELREVAKLPGLGLEEAAKGDVRLQAVGFSANTAKQALLQFGNAIALTGGGKFELDSVITQLTQMGSKSKVLAEDLKPILTASPAVAKAIKQMFGTVDSEQISAKLQAAGRGPQDFIQDLIKQLSGLDRVAGGPKNAIENLGDAVKIAQFNFGQAADKALNLTGVLNGIGNYVTGLADKFATLSPATQQIILAIGGVAAAIGPLTLAVGGFISVLPTLKAGFLALSGPVGLTIAAIAGAAILIAANWDSIRSTLTSSGVWDAMVSVVRSGVDAARGVFTAAVGLTSVVWDRFGGFLIAAGKTAFEGVAAAFRFGAGLLQGVFQVLTGIFTLDWQKGLGGLVTIAKTFWNAVVDVFKLGAAVVGRTIAETFRTFGATTIADKITAGIDKALVKLDGLKGKVNEVQLGTKAVKPISVSVVPKITAKPFDYSSIDLGGSALKKAKDRLKELQDQIASGKLAGKDVTGLQAEFDTLKARIDSATESTKKHTAAHVAAQSPLTTNERILKSLSSQLRELGDSAPDSLRNQVAAVGQLVAEEKRAVQGAVDLGEALKNIKAPAQNQTRVDSLLKAGGVTTAGLFGQTATIGLPGLSDFLKNLAEIKKKGDLSPIQNRIEQIQQLISRTTLDNLTVPKKAVQSLGYYIGQLDKVDKAQQKALMQAREQAEELRLSKLPQLNIGDLLGKASEKLRLGDLAKTLGLDKLAATLKLNVVFDKVKGVAEKIPGLAGIMRIYSDAADTVEQRTQSLNQSLTTSVQTAAAGMGESLGTIIGGMIAGTARLSDLPKALGSVFVDLAKSMGQALIGFGTAALAAKSLISNPVTAIVAGVTLIALSSALQASLSKSSAKAFANGGLVYGPTLGLVGEGRGTTRSNPEVIAPLDKLKTYIGGGSQDIHVTGEFRQDGYDLVALIDQVVAKRERFR